jgi:hypothetical protein
MRRAVSAAQTDKMFAYSRVLYFDMNISSQRRLAPARALASSLSSGAAFENIFH